MPGATPIYGFPYPDPSDLVANYPALGQDLAEDVENVIAGLGSGLNIVTPTTIANSGGTATLTGSTVSFSGVTTVSLNGIFSATYSRYQVEIFGGGSTSPGANANLRLRVAGVDASGANYFYQRGVFVSSTAAASRASSQTVFFMGTWDSIDTTIIRMTVDRPFVADDTTFLSTGGSNGDPGNTTLLDLFYGAHGLATSYDGFTISAATGNITGTIRVYGIED